jgi:predicted HTH transcriptional regulator
VGEKRGKLNRTENHPEAKSGKGGFPDFLWESYSAFANTDGGIILWGIEEDSQR